MFKRLSVLTRLFVFLLAGATLLALGVAQFDSSRLAVVPTLSLRWDTLSPDRWTRYEQEKGFYLIDRVSGSNNLVSLPDEVHWGLLSVSPWSDSEGKSEVIGHCHSLAAPLDGHPFWGPARVSLPEGKVIDRVKLDLLPLGRVCWLPERRGEILFAAGDGQFYRCGFRADEDAGVGTEPDSGEVSPRSGVRQVVWKCPRPGKGSVLVADPVWPIHPRFRNVIFATLSYSNRPGDKTMKVPFQPWWFLLSVDGEAIEAAGPLLPQSSQSWPDADSAKHFPNVAVAADGTVSMIYLSRPQDFRYMRLEGTTIDIDPASGLPQTLADRPPQVLAEECATVPPVFSADAKAAFVISAKSGRVVQCRVDLDEARRAVRLAGKLPPRGASPVVPPHL
jgi:hypothetical protein